MQIILSVEKIICVTVSMPYSISTFLLALLKRILDFWWNPEAEFIVSYCPIATGVAPCFHLPLIMPTLNELLLLVSRPKQLLLCLFAHRKRELSPFKISWYHPFNIISLNTATTKLFTFFKALMLCIVYWLNVLLIIYQIFSPIYIYLNIHSNIICIAITGNKILCLIDDSASLFIAWRAGVNYIPPVGD